MMKGLGNMKKYIAVLTLVFVAGFLQAQKPVIKYVDKTSGAATETVDILGSGFDADASKMKVYFGGVPGKIVASSESSLMVETPAGAVYDNIRATNLTTKRSGASIGQFLPSFGGDAFDPSKLTQQELYPGGASGPVLLDFCLCDLDQDGRNDYIAGNTAGSGVYIVRNQSDPGAISSMPRLISLFMPINYVACGDVNNDGKMDIVAVRGGNLSDRIYVLINTSTGPGNISFAPTPIMLNATGSTVLSKVKVADMDNDGLNDVVATDNSSRETGVNPAIHIFRNTTKTQQVSFESQPTSIVIAGEDFKSGAYGLEIQDLNNDGYPEIITAPTLGSAIGILTNKSGPGALHFEPEVIKATAPIYDLRSVDLDGDGRQDIVASKIEKNFLIWMNQTGADKKVRFGPYITYGTGRKIYSVDAGDLNGDGKADLVFSSLDDNLSFCVLVNTTSGAAPQFTEHIVPARIKQRPLKIADIDNDGRPDITLGLSDNLLSVYRNTNCVEASTFPSGDVTICADVPLDIEAVRGVNLTYTWRLNGAEVDDVNALNTPVYESAEPGEYTVTIHSDNGACESSSELVNVTLSAGSSPSKPTIANAGPACAGVTLTLSAADPGGAASFIWEGPGGWTSTEAAPEIANVRLEHVGYYTLQGVGSTGCKSLKDTVSIDVISLPEIEIAGPDAICEGTGATLSVSNFDDLQYQWKMNSQVLAGKNTAAITVDQVGVYAAVVSKGGCSLESPAFRLESVALPEADFESKAEACVGEVVDFQNLSNIPLEKEVIYEWDFGDGATSQSKNPSHAYLEKGTYTVKLKAAYQNTTCQSTIQKTAVIKQAIPAEIVAPAIDFCPGDSVMLSLQEAYSSYSWSNGKKGSSIYAYEGGEYSVIVADPSGCLDTARIFLNRHPEKEFSVSTSTGDTILSYGKAIQIVAGDQFIDYTWTPATGLTDPHIYNPTASPRKTTTYLATAVDEETGCKVSAEITIVLEESGPKLKAARIISPNGDDKNQVWEIEDILSHPDSELSIVDGSGRKVFEARPYLNNWEGDFNGAPLPEGVYYYILKFFDSGTVQTGSILLVR